MRTLHPYLSFLLFLIFLSGSSARSQIPSSEPGVSQALAKWRAANYSDIRYKLNITLEKGAPLMRGEIEVRVNLTDEGAKNDLILDWRTTQFATDKDKPFADVIQVNESVIKKLPESGNYAYLIDKEHIVIAPRLLKTGENVIKIKFASPIKTSGAAITRYVDKEDGAEYVYSLFVPSDASTAFPVFDQPDLKARFTLNLLLPPDWKAVSNTQGQVTDKLIEDYREVSKTKTEVVLENHRFNQVIFLETKPISTYVFAFAAGDFAEFEETDKPAQDKTLNTSKLESEEEPVINIDPNSSTNDPNINQSDVEELPNKSRKLKAKKEKSKDKSTNFVNENSTVKSNTHSSSQTSTSKIYVRKSQAGKFKQHAAEVFRLNREGIKYLETYFDYKFPFPKYDLVLIPEFPFGGMEHAGATFLREDRVIFPTEPTKNDLVTRANVIFHEAAHQWFGDTVTMRWFDDLWLKEGFAEFMAYKTMEKVLPEYNAWKIFYERNKQAAYLTDSTRGTTPIYQEIENLSAAKSAYGNIVYRKAPSFLRQAEFYLGEDKFQTAVRAFLKKHEFKNAEWTDLVKEFELASKQDLKDWANVWVKQRGLPIFSRGTKNVHVGNPWRDAFVEYSLDQEDVLKEKGLWQMKTNVLMRFDGENDVKAVKIAGEETPIGRYWTCCAPRNTEKTPDFIFPNYQDYGYGIFLLDEKSRAYVLANIQTEKDDFLRTMMWGALWDSVREGELDPKDYVTLVVKNIHVETDESTINTILGRVSTAMNYYLNDKQREEVAEKVEDILIEQMTSARTKGQRITFYRAFLNIASTKKAALALDNILDANNNATPAKLEAAKKEANKDNKKLEFAGLPILSTKDKFDIVTKLLILGYADAPRFLAELEKSETTDEAKRSAYAAKAGIGKAENKAKFWTDFVGNKELSESWIEAATLPFNSLLHSELTLPYLEKALAELPNLKRNRKIFFVNGWLAAFIGGQKSEEALAIVNKFLADNPNLDKDLRLKILENTDNLERAVRIRAKFAG